MPTRSQPYKSMTKSDLFKSPGRGCLNFLRSSQECLAFPISLSDIPVTKLSTTSPLIMTTWLVHIPPRIPSINTMIELSALVGPLWTDKPWDCKLILLGSVQQNEITVWVWYIWVMWILCQPILVVLKVVQAHVIVGGAYVLWSLLWERLQFIASLHIR